MGSGLWRVRAAKAMAVAAAALLVGAACGGEEAAVGASVAKAWIAVNNHSAKDVEVFVDEAHVGQLAPQASETYEGAFEGTHSLYARATDGSEWWGPVEVTVEKAGTHTWNLWE